MGNAVVLNHTLLDGLKFVLLVSTPHCADTCCTKTTEIAITALNTVLRFIHYKQYLNNDG